MDFPEPGPKPTFVTNEPSEYLRMSAQESVGWTPSLSYNQFKYEGNVIKHPNYFSFFLLTQGTHPNWITKTSLAISLFSKLDKCTLNPHVQTGHHS